MEEKKQSLLTVLIELQRLSNIGVIDMLAAAIERLNECGEEAERKNDAIRELLRSVYYNKTTREFAIAIGNNPDFMPTNFIQISGELSALKENLQRLLNAFKDIMPHKEEDTIEDVVIENYMKED